MSICLFHSIYVSNFNKRKGFVKDNHLPLKKCPRIISCYSMNDDELQPVQGLLLLNSTTTSIQKIEGGDDDERQQQQLYQANLSDESLRPSKI